MMSGWPDDGAPESCLSIAPRCRSTPTIYLLDECME